MLPSIPTPWPDEEADLQLQMDIVKRMKAITNILTNKNPTEDRKKELGEELEILKEQQKAFADLDRIK